MDCVEVTPLRDLLYRRAAEAGKDKRRQQQRTDLDVHASEITPERPFVPRVMREQLEKDEIGKSLGFRKLTLCGGINVIVMQYLKHQTQY
jgi:hypothetical protein